MSAPDSVKTQQGQDWLLVMICPKRVYKGVTAAVLSLQ